jgi:hypothetical protein
MWGGGGAICAHPSAEHGVEKLQAGPLGIGGAGVGRQLGRPDTAWAANLTVTSGDDKPGVINTGVINHWSDEWRQQPGLIVAFWCVCV